MKRLILIGMLALGACSEGGVIPPPRAGYVPVPSARPAPGPAAPLPGNIGALRGATAPGLIARFGKPQLDMSEGTARKLQFAGPICVLDTYLYPQKRGEPVVTHIDARQRDGRPIDEASCVAALSGGRPGGR
ncbi:hypothetical protein JMG10_23985, partial [Nostoc ellipsosporum NOK]|uniref:hypothetical protein n=1 Tax=Sphingomonas sp. IBVSS2 TaxID=1985172 RepID=UPI000A2D87DA|nr:hypothetical protein [Sphingomonas sp. IBVSS2]MDF2384553.1 hypothetical protein [Nostoc ellipsosporum NOK]OSZ68162.1 hypothetical protein CAP40_06075 [Sphingomonas sp. IBVSS2]